MRIVKKLELMGRIWLRGLLKSSPVVKVGVVYLDWKLIGRGLGV